MVSCHIEKKTSRTTTRTTSYAIIPYDIICYHMVSCHIEKDIENHHQNHLICHHSIWYHMLSYGIIPYWKNIDNHHQNHLICHHTICYYMLTYGIMSYSKRHREPPPEPPHMSSYHMVSCASIWYHVILKRHWEPPPEPRHAIIAYDSICYHMLPYAIMAYWKDIENHHQNYLMSSYHMI